MAQIFIPLIFLTVVALASCEIPSSWDALLGSDFPLFSQTTKSVSDILSSTEVNGHVLHSRVLRELNSVLTNPEILSEIYTKYLAAYEKPATRSHQHVFIKNVMKIAKQNLLFLTGKSSWMEGINAAADESAQELAQGLGRASDSDDGLIFAGAEPVPWNATLGQAPDSWDWRDYGFVGPVKEQGACASCWAFAAVGATEGAIAKRDQARVVPLSEQELVDCYKTSCNGDHENRALDWIRRNGIASEQDYPYTERSRKDGSAGSCESKSKTVNRGEIRGFRTSTNENQFRSLTLEHGPFTVALFYHEDMARFKQGVYQGACGDSSTAHAMTCVGYGNEDGKNYWLVKNSHGTGKNNRGYIKIRAGVNQCGLGGQDFPSFFARV